MPLFGSRQAVDEAAREEVARLRDEITRVQSVVRQIEAEVVGMHDQVRRWMRRAVAAERVVERNQDPHPNGAGDPNGSAAPPAPPPRAANSRINLRGARARIVYRRRLEAEAALLRHVSGGDSGTPHPTSHATDATLPEANPKESEA